jgi:hypothetical protein
MKTTAASITNAQIRTLRTEALDAGDARMGEWCDVAIAAGERYDSEGFPLVSPGTGLACTRTEAREVCADAIANAAANA